MRNRSGAVALSDGAFVAVALLVIDVLAQRMEKTRYDTLLQVWVVVSNAVGIWFILFGDALLTATGVVLVIVGLMSLMPAIRLRLTQESASGG